MHEHAIKRRRQKWHGRPSVLDWCQSTFLYSSFLDLAYYYSLTFLLTGCVRYRQNSQDGMRHRGAEWLHWDIVFITDIYLWSASTALWVPWPRPLYEAGVTEKYTEDNNYELLLWPFLHDSRSTDGQIIQVSTGSTRPIRICQTIDSCRMSDDASFPYAESTLNSSDQSSSVMTSSEMKLSCKPLDYKSFIHHALLKYQ